MQGNYICRFLIKVYEHPPYWRAVSTFFCLLAVGGFILYCFAGVVLAIEFLQVLLFGDPGAKGEEIRNVGLVLVAFLGAPLIIWRSKIAFDQVKTAQERMITDRFSKAVDQIGAVRRVPLSQAAAKTGALRRGSLSRAAAKTGARDNWEEEQPNIEVRLGGLYTLQRISEDSLPDHVRVVETMCAYVRLNSLRQMIRGEGGGGRDERRPPEVDIQAALEILGKRPYERCLYEMNSLITLDFSNSEMRYSNLNSLKLPFVDFDNSDLRFAQLQRTDLRQASLEWANFQSADFHECNLHRALLRGADFRDTNITLETLNSAFGVKTGYGKTLLPDRISKEDLPDWFDAPDVKRESEELRNAYFKAYETFLDKYPETWRPGKKHITINEVILNR